MTEFWQPPKAERPDVVGAGATTVVLTDRERAFLLGSCVSALEATRRGDADAAPESFYAELHEKLAGR